MLLVLIGLVLVVLALMLSDPLDLDVESGAVPGGVATLLFVAALGTQAGMISGGSDASDWAIVGTIATALGWAFLVVAVAIAAFESSSSDRGARETGRTGSSDVSRRLARRRRRRLKERSEAEEE